MRDSLAVGMVQMASGSDFDANLKGVRQILSGLRGRCDLAIFPENVFCLGHGDTVTSAALTMVDWFSILGEVMRDFGSAAIFGGVPIAEDGRVMNASLAFAADGLLLARYDKMHLFQLNPTEPGGIDETRHYGHGPVPMAFEYEGWTIGLSICYDLRFPELYRQYAPCDLLVCTAAFTALTGEAHWETLLRARAIENLCYVTGVGQCGKNPETGTQLHGHSMMITPWGISCVGLQHRDEEVCIAELHRSEITEARKRLPALQHRRFRIIEPDFPEE